MLESYVPKYNLNYGYLIISIIEEVNVVSKEVMIGFPDGQCICPEGHLALHLLVETLGVEVIWEGLVPETLVAGKVLKAFSESLVSQASHSVKERVLLQVEKGNVEIS